MCLNHQTNEDIARVNKMRSHSWMSVTRGDLGKTKFFDHNDKCVDGYDSVRPWY